MVWLGAGLLAQGVRAAGEPRSLLPGGATTLRAAVVEGHAYWVSAEQGGVDVELAVVLPGGGLLEADRPLDRQGSEALLVEPARDGTLEITARGREQGAPAGTVRLAVDDLGPLAAIDPRELTARRATSAVGERYREGTSEAYRRALDAAQTARDAWTVLGAARPAASAAYEAAVLARLSDDPRAAELAKAAREAWLALGEPVWAAAAANEAGLDALAAGDLAAAEASFRRAQGAQQAAGDAYGAAVSASNLCLVALRQGRLSEGARCYREALPSLAAVGAPALEAAALTSMGRAYDVLGDPEAASAAYQRALARFEAAADELGAARSLANLGVLHQRMGELDLALADHGRALRVFAEVGDRRWQARALHNLGLLYLGLGDLAQAELQAGEALPLWREVADRGGEAASLTTLGLVALRRQQADAARLRFEQALRLRRATGDRRGEAEVLDQLARTDLEAGEPARAVAGFSAALSLLTAIGDRVEASEARRGRGEARLATGDAVAAQADLAAAVAEMAAIGYRPGEAQALYWLALAERRLGHGAAALAAVERSAELSEGLRGGVGGPDLRAEYSELKAPVYELWVDVLMAAHRQSPDAGLDRRALAVSERAKARTLLELITTAGAAPPAAELPPALVARQRSLARQLAAHLEGLWRSPPEGDAAREAANQHQHRLLAELDRTEAELRAANPSYAALLPAATLDASEIQSLLGDGTLLLVYALGEERSTLWAVSAGAIASFELPRRAVIDAAVGRCLAALTRFDPATRLQQQEALAALAELVLGPLTAGPQAAPLPQRLAVVPDGALAYVPFAALPEPVGSGGRPPLLVDHEVVSLASASTLAEERRLLVRRQALPPRIAVLADPVFSAADPRLPADLATGEAGEPAPALPRLAGSRAEAAAIVALATPGSATVWTDFAASRSRVLAGELAGYRYLHFATHGWVDDAHPEATALALSLFDDSGARVAGLLHLRDLAGLRLDAEVAVLSGCRTAWGREIRGEGLVGLGRAFLAAGVPRVVASLWPVDDRATARLMEHFYRGLWRDGLPPAAALRAAQRELATERRYRDPFFWGSFILLGPW